MSFSKASQILVDSKIADEAINNGYTLGNGTYKQKSEGDLPYKIWDYPSIGYASICISEVVLGVVAEKEKQCALVGFFWPNENGNRITHGKNKKKVKNLLLNHSEWFDKYEMTSQIENGLSQENRFRDVANITKLKTLYLVAPIRNNEDDVKNDLLELLNNVVKEYNPPNKLSKNRSNKGIEEVNMNNSKYSNYISLLTANHNIILHGAPGTGKTYLAREIAKAMGCTKDEMEFVQFHPSYDYTDFVEGPRPTQKTDSDNGFELVDGCFKKFCEAALDNLIKSKKSNDEIQKESGWEDLLDDLLDNDSEKYSTASGTSFSISKSDEKYIWASIPENEKVKEVKIRKSRILQLLNNSEEIKLVKDVRDFFGEKFGTQENSYVFALYQKIRGKKVDAKQNTTTSTKTIAEKKYVFIIDEINRGDMSKIFGELFFSIDPGYRGVEGTVKTQYANIADGTSRFDEILHNESDLKKILKKDLDVAHYVKEPLSNGYFFIPENVYIIGTMNDIDRSVESMDFAMRRRFVFEEIKAEDSAKNFNPPLSSEALKRMTNLNKAIWDESAKDKKKKGISGLSSAYHIGPAYFKDFKDDDNTEDFWNRRLKGLLTEYLRGTRNATADLETLKKAFTMQVGSEQPNSETPNQDAES